MKTVHEIFTSGVKEITAEPALFSNVLEYKGKYFKIGVSWLEVKKNKVADVGSWTVDIMPVVNHELDGPSCVTQPHGIIQALADFAKHTLKNANHS